MEAIRPEPAAVRRPGPADGIAPSRHLGADEATTPTETGSLNGIFRNRQRSNGLAPAPKSEAGNAAGPARVVSKGSV